MNMIMKKTKIMALLLSATLVFSGCGNMNNTAKGGLIGGGGLGQIAITYGYQKYDDQIVWLCVALTILIVQILQEFGMYIARRTDRRAHS